MHYVSEKAQLRYNYALIYDYQLLRHDKMKLRLILYEYIRLLRLSHDNTYLKS